MTQLTLRGLDAELEQHLRQVAKLFDLSLEEAALYLLRKGAGLDSPRNRADRVGSALDEFIGVLSEQEERELRQSNQILGQIDEKFWE